MGSPDPDGVERPAGTDVGKDGVDAAREQGARPATMGGDRTMGGVVTVAAQDLPDAGTLDAWVHPAVARAAAKPPKKSKG